VIPTRCTDCSAGIPYRLSRMKTIGADVEHHRTRSASDEITRIPSRYSWYAIVRPQTITVIQAIRDSPAHSFAPTGVERAKSHSAIFG
jgi:hypothetical protein